MKILKPLLWFLVPTVIIWVAYFLLSTVIGGTANRPSLAGNEYYLNLFVNDTVFPKALLNTLVISFAPAVLVAVISYIGKLIFKFNSVIMYFVAFILSTLAVFFANSILFGTPINFNVFSIVSAIQIGIICCFICWTLNIIKTKVQSKYGK